MGNPIILLLEDEPVIAADLADLLGDLGCQVLWAADRQEALVLCAARLPALVVLNFRQPDGSDGMAFARSLSSIYELKIGFVTGARPEDLAESADFEALYPILYKPFTRSQCNEFLRACGMFLDR